MRVVYTGQPDELCPITLLPFCELEHPVVILPDSEYPFELRELVHWLKVRRVNPRTNLKLSWRYSAREIIGIVDCVNNSDSVFDPLDFNFGRQLFTYFFADPYFLVYNITVILSIASQLPLAECTKACGMDLCGVWNTIMILCGCLYSGVRFGVENRRTGWLAFAMSIFVKLFSSTALPTDSVPSVMVASMVYVLNACIHVSEMF
jgi:hypothetical protein